MIGEEYQSLRAGEMTSSSSASFPYPTQSSQQFGNRSKYRVCATERIEEHPALLHTLA